MARLASAGPHLNYRGAGQPLASCQAPRYRWTHALSPGDGLVGDRLTDPVQEVLEGRLGHAVQQDPVDGPPDGAEGRPVASADSQLGPVLAARADLDVGLRTAQQ